MTSCENQQCHGNKQRKGRKESEINRLLLFSKNFSCQVYLGLPHDGIRLRYYSLQLVSQNSQKLNQLR